jgi:hypothetical protein
MDLYHIYSAIKHKHVLPMDKLEALHISLKKECCLPCLMPSFLQTVLVRLQH